MLTFFKFFCIKSTSTDHFPQFLCDLSDNSCKRGDPLGWFPYRVHVRIRVNGDVSEMVSALASMLSREVPSSSPGIFKIIFRPRLHPVKVIPC